MKSKNDAFSFSTKEFEEFVENTKKVQDLGFNLQSLKNLLLQEKFKKNKLKHTFTLDLENKFIYISSVEKRAFNKPEKVRTSGHYFDNKLKSTPSMQRQKKLFDVLLPRKKDKLDTADYQIKAEGIQLTPPQNRLITALTNLLHDKSEHEDIVSGEFYGENYTSIPVNNYGGIGEPSNAPVIQIKPSELYKSYLNSDRYSGADIKFIRKLIAELSEKKFLIAMTGKSK